MNESTRNFSCRSPTRFITIEKQNYFFEPREKFLLSIRK